MTASETGETQTTPDYSDTLGGVTERTQDLADQDADLQEAIDKEEAKDA